MSVKINNKYEKFVKLLELHTSRYNPVDVFKDFVCMFAIAIKNATYFEQTDEDLYMTIVKKYQQKERYAFMELIQELINLLFKEGKIIDCLGEIYTQIGCISKGSQQFFTPNHIAKLLASVEIDVKELQSKKKVTIQDPSCGSGVMLLSAADFLKDNNINLTEKITFIGQDIDFTCACMTYLQLSLYGLPGIITWENTLTEDVHKRFYTPQYVLENCNRKNEIC